MRTTEMTFKFKAEDLKRIIDKGAATILVEINVKKASVDGRTVGYLDVKAKGYKGGEVFNTASDPQPVGEADGCPVPPCGGNDGVEG